MAKFVEMDEKVTLKDQMEEEVSGPFHHQILISATILICAVRVVRP